VQVTTRLIYLAVAKRRGLHGDRGDHPPQLIGQLRISGHQAPQSAMLLANQSLLDPFIPDLPSSQHLSAGLFLARFAPSRPEPDAPAATTPPTAPPALILLPPL
jgi:hypothetical protein